MRAASWVGIAAVRLDFVGVLRESDAARQILGLQLREFRLEIGRRIVVRQRIPRPHGRPDHAFLYLIEPIMTGSTMLHSFGPWDPRLLVTIHVDATQFALSVRDFWRSNYLHIPEGILHTFFIRFYLWHHRVVVLLKAEVLGIDMSIIINGILSPASCGFIMLTLLRLLLRILRVSVWNYGVVIPWWDLRILFRVIFQFSSILLLLKIGKSKLFSSGFVMSIWRG